MSWSHKLARPIGVAKPKPRTLNTLADARAYMLSIKDGRERREYWQHAAKLVLEAADGGSVEAVTRQLMTALLLDGTLDMDRRWAKNAEAELSDPARKTPAGVLGGTIGWGSSCLV